MVRRHNLRPVGLDTSITDPDLIHAIHEFCDEIETKVCNPECFDPAFWRKDHLRVLNCILHFVDGIHISPALAGRPLLLDYRTKNTVEYSTVFSKANSCPSLT